MNHGRRRINNETKKALEIVNDCLYNGKIIQEAFNYSFLYTTQEALEKQIPIKVEYISEVDGEGYPVWIEDFCPICKAELNRCDYYNYCPYCGQAIDWRD